MQFQHEDNNLGKGFSTSTRAYSSCAWAKPFPKIVIHVLRKGPKEPYLLTLKQVRMLLHRVFQPNVICLAKLIISQQTSSSAELFFSLIPLSNKVIELSKFHDVTLTKLMNCKLFFILFFLCVCAFFAWKLEPIKIFSNFLTANYPY